MGVKSQLYVPPAYPCVAPVFIWELVAPSLKMSSVSSVQKKDKMADGSLFPSLLRWSTFFKFVSNWHAMLSKLHITHWRPLDSKTSTTTSTRFSQQWCLRVNQAAWTSVILAGKRGSRRHSTSSLSENVVVAETGYQMLEVWSFCDRKRV